MTTSTVWQDWSCRVRVTLEGGTARDLDRATTLVRELMADVSRAASRFRDDSDLARINADAGLLVPVRPLTLRLVDVATEAARRTDGAVDPTVGTQVVAAGYDADIDVVRARRTQLTRSCERRARWTDVAVDHQLGRVGVARGLALDLGATAKAWTADEAARRIVARWAGGVLVEIGGDLSVAGHPTRPWSIDVAETADGPTTRVSLSHGGLATSSVLGRRWTSERGEENHVIDPATSRPVLGAIRTATVWAATAAEANTWSTAALVWGGAAPDRLRAAGVDARLVRADGTSTRVGDWPEDERSAA